jgi:hypothetical protein
MSNLTGVLLIAICINAVLFIGQAAVIEIDSSPASMFYQCDGNMLERFDANGCTNPNSYVISSEESLEQLPGGTASTSPTTGNVFTDIFSTAKDWLIDNIPGLGYLKQVLTAPYNLLSALGLPNILVFTMGTIWYGVTFFLIVAFLLGRQLE